MRLCGISSRFQLLSPCMRQVTHALLTRPPLSHKIFISEENQIECFVRLACVRHAASVHPEPGSNSHVKMVFVSCQFYLALFTVNSGSFSIFRSICLFLNLAIHFSENLGIFRVALLFICQRSVILLLLLFSAATLISYHDRFRLSTTFLKTFLS